MATRRQEKVARVVKEAVSDAIAHRLSDPRIEGFVSVTRVEMSPDLRNANVFLSIFFANPLKQWVFGIFRKIPFRIDILLEIRVAR